MDYNENEFKAKANIKARRIWLVFALLLSANYGTDVSQGGYPSTNYIIFNTVLGSFLPVIFFCASGERPMTAIGMHLSSVTVFLHVPDLHHRFTDCLYLYSSGCQSSGSLQRPEIYGGMCNRQYRQCHCQCLFIIWSFSVRILQRTRKIISCRLPVSCSVISAISCLSATSSNPTVP